MTRLDELKQRLRDAEAILQVIADGVQFKETAEKLAKSYFEQHGKTDTIS
jgi:hypothetical protein